MKRKRIQRCVVRNNDHFCEHIKECDTPMKYHVRDLVLRFDDIFIGHTNPGEYKKCFKLCRRAPVVEII